MLYTMTQITQSDSDIQWYSDTRTGAAYAVVRQQGGIEMVYVERRPGLFEYVGTATDEEDE